RLFHRCQRVVVMAAVTQAGREVGKVAREVLGRAGLWDVAESVGEALPEVLACSDVTGSAERQGQGMSRFPSDGVGVAEALRRRQLEKVAHLRFPARGAGFRLGEGEDPPREVTDGGGASRLVPRGGGIVLGELLRGARRVLPVEGELAGSFGGSLRRSGPEHP